MSCPRLEANWETEAVKNQSNVAQLKKLTIAIKAE